MSNILFTMYLLTYNNLNIVMYYLTGTLELFFILFAIYVILSKNPILSVLYLIGLFLVVSLYLLVLGIYFIGISYLLVYIGAVSILFLFILMLIDIRVSELHVDSLNNILLGSFISLSLYFPLVNFQSLPYNFSQGDFITYHNWEGFILENLDIESIGNILYTNFSLWLFLSLLILLLAMIGAIVINLNNK